MTSESYHREKRGCRGNHFKRGHPGAGMGLLKTRGNNGYLAHMSLVSPAGVILENIGKPPA